ncbi:MAG: hypothetical protein F6K03_18735 [Kamptonema sp. SIO4C4]|nr:hypothetical protein [Kamptonema sp. SIO4C4]
MPKGVKNPITIYDIGGIGGDYNLFLEQEEEIFRSLSEPLLVEFTVLDGKHISKNSTAGQVVQLSEKGACIALKGSDLANTQLASVTSDHTTLFHKPHPLQNIKLVFLNLADSPETKEDVYAKVLDKETHNEGTFYIQFTSKPPRIDHQLKQLYQTLNV